MDNIPENTNLKHRLVIGLFFLTAIIIFGLLWLFFLSPSNPTGFGWFLFSFAAGLSMIVLPCTLPLAFVIVPLSMGKGIAKGLGIAISFGLGITFTLSFYGVLAAIVGQFAIGSLGAPLETVKNWVYFIAGIFALLFALGEIGLLKFRMPSYTGAAPAFIQKRKDFAKAFFLGLFLGNIGVGCPHPATPLILIEIASSGNVLYGWLLFFVHALGRVLPLLFLAFLGILGVNGLSWLVARKEKVEKATGWAMVFVAGFILTLGLFSHDWWVNSGIHTQLEKITQEERLLNIVKENLNSTVTHSHGMETGTGLFGLPLGLGNWVLVLLWVVPIWIWWYKKRKTIAIIPDTNTVPEKLSESKILNVKKYLFVAITALVTLIFVYTLPHNFLKHEALEEHGHAPGTSDNHAHDEEGMTEDHAEHMDEMMNHGHAPGTPENHDHNDGGGVMMDHTDEMMHGEGGGHAGHGAMYHEESDVKDGIVVNFVTPKKLVTGTKGTLNFNTVLLPEKTPVDDLDLVHEKYLHVIGVRDDLTNFFHIHPNSEGSGKWSVDYTFANSGKYRVWSDITYKGTTHSFGHSTFEVKAGNAKEVKEEVKYIEFYKNVVVDKYQVAISHPEPIVAGRDTNIDFILKDYTGNGIEVEPYLGADMHLAIIKDDLSTYLHTHPEDHVGGNMKIEGDGHNHSHSLLRKIFVDEALAHGTAPEDLLAPNHLTFNVNFPKPGVYKMFAQFRPEGISLPKDESLVAEFYVKVAETGPAYPVVLAETKEPYKAPSRVVLVIISLILIGVLGLVSYKFINVKS